MLVHLEPAGDRGSAHVADAVDQARHDPAAIQHLHETLAVEEQALGDLEAEAADLAVPRRVLARDRIEQATEAILGVSADPQWFSPPAGGESAVMWGV